MDHERLHVDHVSFSWPGHHSTEAQLQDITFTLLPQESLVLMGASGIGKTTLCRLMAGLLTPSAGAITFEGQPVSGARSAITISFQHYPCFPWLSIKQNVLFGLPEDPAHADRKTRSEYAHWLLDKLGLSASAKSYPNQLSGGMLQRVSLARALATHPKVLILDEPFSALDVATKSSLIELIADLQSAAGFSLIVVLHSLEDAMSVADRTLVLADRPASVARNITMTGLTFEEFHPMVLEAIGCYADNGQHKGRSEGGGKEEIH